MIKKRLKTKKVNNTSNVEKIAFHNFALYDISFKTVYNVILVCQNQKIFYYFLFIYFIYTHLSKNIATRVHRI